MTKYHDIELMQHTDGELAGSAKRDLDQRLATDRDASTKRDGMREMTELVRGHLELSADAVPDARFFQMWDRVDAAIAKEQAAEPERASWLRRLVHWFDRHRSHLLTGALSAGAVATLALVLRGGAGDDAGTSGGGALKVQPVNLRTPPRIESLETPGGAGTVLNIEDEDGHATVIWVTPEDTVEGI